MLENLEFYKSLVSDRGAAVAAAMAHVRTNGGAEWLQAFKDANPDLCRLVEICAEPNCEKAFSTLSLDLEKYCLDNGGSILGPSYWYLAEQFLNENKAEIFELHYRIKAELDAPR